MCFLINLQSHGKRQLNPSNGESLGNILQNRSYWENLWNQYSYFSHSIGAFFHQIPVYFITWEMHVFVHQIFDSIRKVSKMHQMGKTWESGLHTFYIKWVVFFHYFPIPQYTSSYGKYMSFLINFPQHGKRQESPSNGKSLENWFTRKSYKTHRIFFLLSMGNFLPSDFDLIVYMGNVWLFRSFSISTGKCSQMHPVSSQVAFPQYYCFYLLQNLVIP